MPKFEGCEAGHEISFVKRGANPHTAILLKKNAPSTPAEKAVMDAKMLKALAGMDDVTKTYLVGLDDEKAVAFVAKAADEQKAEAHAAHDAAEAEKAAKEAKKAGKTAKEAELEKHLSDQATEIADLKKALAEDRATAELEKRANTEFAGYPGGNEKVIPILKAAAAMPEDQRKVIEDQIKAHITLAKSAGATFGKSQDELNALAPVQTEVAAKAAELAKAKGITVEAAKGEVLASDIDLMARAFAEEQRQPAQ